MHSYARPDPNAGWLLAQCLSRDQAATGGHRWIWQTGSADSGWVAASTNQKMGWCLRLALFAMEIQIAAKRTDDTGRPLPDVQSGTVLLVSWTAEYFHLIAIGRQLAQAANTVTSTGSNTLGLR